MSADFAARKSKLPAELDLLKKDLESLTFSIPANLADPLDRPLERHFSQSADKAQDGGMLHGVKQLIEHNPLASCFFAGAIGFGLGLISRRRGS